MTRNGCIRFYQSSTYKLKLPSEVMPGLLIIQIQIQAMWDDMVVLRLLSNAMLT